MRREPRREKPAATNCIDKPEMAWNKRVRAHAERSELSFAEIARRAPMTERRMRRLMTGRTLMRASDMEVFARVLGMTIEALYREPGQRRAA